MPEDPIVDLKLMSHHPGTYNVSANYILHLTTDVWLPELKTSEPVATFRMLLFNMY